MMCFDFRSSPPPKIVFHRLNGKRYNGAAAEKPDSLAEGFTPAHEENVKFVYEGNTSSL